MENLLELLNSNQLVSSSVLLTLSGIAFTYLRQVPGELWKALSHICKRFGFVSVRIEEENMLFKWCRLWLHEHFEVKRNFMSFVQGTDGDNRPKILTLPAPGSHFGAFHGIPMWIHHERSNTTKATDFFSMLKGDAYVVTFLSFRSDIVHRFLNECRDLASPADEKISIMVARSDYWALVDRIEPRPISSLIYPKDQHLSLLNDVRRFQQSKKWYQDRNVPYHRGYLLYGAPGNGKSSLITAIASELKMNMHILQMNKQINDQNIVSLFSSIEPNSIVVIEDIDCIFEQRSNKANDSSLTLSGLLNVLDGVFAKDGRILFITTNHIGRLDPALVRPGRVDVRLEVTNATRAQAVAMFEKFYPGEEIPSDILNFQDFEMSMAALQERIIGDTLNTIISVN